MIAPYQIIARYYMDCEDQVPSCISNWIDDTFERFEKDRQHLSQESWNEYFANNLKAKYNATFETISGVSIVEIFTFENEDDMMRFALEWS